MPRQIATDRDLAAGFDATLDRRSAADCKKWRLYPEDILPMWVADMDFGVAEPILAALRRRIAHPVFGYAQAPEALREAIVAAMVDRHGWTIQPEHLVFLPGVEPGFNMALKAFLAPGDGVLVQTPMYRPILSAPGHRGMRRVDAPLTPSDRGYTVDLEAFDGLMSGCRALLLCNPHNPTGKVFTDAELTRMAVACERRDALVISDEIHCDLVFGGKRHRPIAALSPEVARRTITLMSASKAWNIAGLKTAFAIIPDPRMRERFQQARLGMVDSVNLMGLEATRAAYAEGDAWRRAAIAYLEGNRDHLAQELARSFPKVGFRPPEASFLAWLDCTALGLQPHPQEYLLKEARVGLSAGLEFGSLGAHHIRLNFGCPRAILDTALDRMEEALVRLR
jgi:cystathionine beta-lyase